ncbi:hypothetical protein M422DRAFT_175807 [Sphaerobolus stellatus SS14]|uniref:RRM domain-containing protein n=1 Tax=Sphaerobolus stellatus (strain SS14) TaxID=990650 RepID=A0A0C9UVS0_SPHS4|nr:hypothetical protein M422DRAFT_175807 [Sphaerobolus stellatus SS14]
MAETAQHGQHPFLAAPLLYIDNLPPHVTDPDLARALEACVPFRPSINRDQDGPLAGTLEFKELAKGVSAEKALATLNNRLIPFVTPAATMHLSPYPPSNPPQPLPPAQAQPRLIKHLPSQFSDSALYDLCRPFGPLSSCNASVHGFVEGTGIVEFFYEEDARAAETALHCAEVGDSNIAVQVYNPRRATGTTTAPASDFNPNASSFVPGVGMSQYSPPRSQYGGFARTPAPFVHGPGQQVQFAPVHGPGSNSHSGLIDPCNLFCKNLDPEIDSNGLFSHFRRFGQIVSARVMRDETGRSRGFGFVSFQQPDQAAHALQIMNGMVLGSKQLVVRLHEPKQLRQEKLAHRFANTGHPRTRSGSGATSPTPSEGGESVWGRSSPGGPVSPTQTQTQDRVRRSSGSYYTAALSGNLNLPMRYDDLSALSPVVRREVLTGELSRRVKEAPGVTLPDASSATLDGIIDALLALPLQELVDGIHDPAKLAAQVHLVLDPQSDPEPEERRLAPPPTSPSPANSQDSRLLDPNATASAPEHPSTPVSFSQSSTPPRTSSPSGSVAPLTERDRLLAAVSKLDKPNASEITDLLMSLSKRERALCLFNADVLKAKVKEAVDVLAVVEDDEDVVKPVKAVPAPATPASKATAKAAEYPQTPELSSSRSVSAVASPSSPGPQTPSIAVPAPNSPTPPPSTPGPTPHTLATLARLPALEIVRLANSNGGNATGLPLAKADPLIVQQTNAFIDGLAGKAVQQQKQLLGEKLFRVVKSFGVKSAPKVTIALLDQEDLRSLAHLMNSYPAVLKEKALLQPLAK